MYGDGELSGGEAGVDVAALDLLLEGLQIERGRAQALHQRRNRQTVLQHTHAHTASSCVSSCARHDTTRHDTTRHDTTRHDTTRHDTTRHDTTHARRVDSVLVCVPATKR